MLAGHSIFYSVKSEAYQLFRLILTYNLIGYSVKSEALHIMSRSLGKRGEAETDLAKPKEVRKQTSRSLFEAFLWIFVLDAVGCLFFERNLEFDHRSVPLLFLIDTSRFSVRYVDVLKANQEIY